MVSAMKSTNQIYRYAAHVKKYMIKNGNYYIRNNERTREQLNLNKKQLTYGIKYLENNGVLTPWSKKVYKLIKK
jgi:hypothetical protein